VFESWILKRRRETGEVDPKPNPGPPARKGAALEEALPSQLRANPDFTLEEHRQLFEETYGMSVSTSRASAGLLSGSVCHSKKDTLCFRERDEEERATWREQIIGQIDPKLLVFVDECGTHTSMTRRYARAPKGERAYGSVPRNRGKNATLLASMTLEGMGAAMAVEGSTTQRVFEAYVERFLAPTLKPGQERSSWIIWAPTKVRRLSN
jgi:transposase